MDRDYLIAILFAGALLFELLFYWGSSTLYEREDDSQHPPRFPRRWFVTLLIGTGTLAVVLWLTAFRLDYTQ